MGWLDRLICPLIQLAEYIGATWIVTIWLGFFGAALLWATVLRFFRRLTPPGSGTIAAGWVGCVGIALLIYLLGIAVDPLLQTLLEQPAAIGDEKWNRIGFFEWKVLGGEWSWPVLPLTDFPQVGIVVHTVLWVGFILLIRIVLLWIYRDLRVGWATRSETLPFYYRWVGSSTARRADDRFKTWLRPLVYVLIPLHALAGYVLAIQSDGRMERANLACQEGGVALPTDIDLRRPETGGLSEELGRLLDDARGGSPEELQRFVTNAQEEMPELGRLLRDAQAGRPEGLEQFLREEGRQGNISELLEETGAEQALEDARGSIQAAVGESLGERLGLGPMPAAPPPGAWVLFGFLLVSLSVHLIIRGRPKEQPKEEKKDDNLDELLEPPPDPLRRLGNALQATIPGAFLESLEEHDAVKEERVAFSSNESPLVREAFSSLTGAEAPWAHQKEVLDHLASVWKMAAPELEGGAPTLEEVVGPSPVRADESGPPHALVLTPEGSGRTTLSCLLSLFVHLDRGATTLVVLRDRDGAKAWAQRFREALTKSSARWNVQVTIAGEDMSTALLAGRTPAVVVAGLEELETDVLQNRRTSAFFEKLGLIVADDVDRFTGVAEMHLHMVMRRIWTVLDTLHDAPYPTALLAIAGPSA
ncbi:MAG: DEAD/DEAH box helicase, partial [Myxococcota bacterium]